MNKQQFHIVIMGAPGCGKGTQAKQLIEHFDFKHLSTGELFREKYARQNEETKAGKESIDKGGFFSNKIAFQIIHDFITENKKAKGIIYDGFPRDLAQANYFLENICNTPIVIELKANEERLIQRLIERRNRENREDDKSEDIIRHRIELYKEKTYPIIEFFSEKNLLHSFQSEGEIEKVANQIKALITSIQ